MGKKTVSFNKTGLQKLPNDKPVLYRIKSGGGDLNYVGVAKRGRVSDRLAEHLRPGGDHIPGAKVQIEQTRTIVAAKDKEARVISRSRPKYNKQGK